MTMRRSGIGVLAALALTGCISFGAEPPPSLLTLSPDAAVPIGQPQSSGDGRTITIAVPVTPQSLAQPRVPVQATPTSIAYVKDAVWAEPPARLFARLLADTLTARTGRIVLSPQSNVDPGAQLGGELRRFGLDATAREAVVTYDATLIRGGGGAVEKRRFEAKVPAPVIDATTAGPLLNQAANQIAVEVADWVGR